MSVILLFAFSLQYLSSQFFLWYLTRFLGDFPRQEYKPRVPCEETWFSWLDKAWSCTPCSSLVHKSTPIIIDWRQISHAQTHSTLGVWFYGSRQVCIMKNIIINKIYIICIQVESVYSVHVKGHNWTSGLSQKVQKLSKPTEKWKQRWPHWSSISSLYSFN